MKNKRETEQIMIPLIKQGLRLAYPWSSYSAKEQKLMTKLAKKYENTNK